MTMLKDFAFALACCLLSVAFGVSVAVITMPGSF